MVYVLLITFLWLMNAEYALDGGRSVLFFCGLSPEGAGATFGRWSDFDALAMSILAACWSSPTRACRIFFLTNSCGNSESRSSWSSRRALRSSTYEFITSKIPWTTWQAYLPCFLRKCRQQIEDDGLINQPLRIASHWGTSWLNGSLKEQQWVRFM
jgi:hypothetical protein